MLMRLTTVGDGRPVSRSPRHVRRRRPRVLCHAQQPLPLRTPQERCDVIDWQEFAFSLKNPFPGAHSTNSKRTLKTTVATKLYDLIIDRQVPIQARQCVLNG